MTSSPSLPPQNETPRHPEYDNSIHDVGQLARKVYLSRLVQKPNWTRLKGKSENAYSGTRNFCLFDRSFLCLNKLVERTVGGWDVIVATRANTSVAESSYGSGQRSIKACPRRCFSSFSCVWERVGEDTSLGLTKPRHLLAVACGSDAP